MPVKKDDVIHSFTRQVADALATAERIIDNRLANFVEGSHVCIDFSQLMLPDDSDVRKRVIMQIKAIYGSPEYGWTVVEHFDQRDGQWLDFS